MTADRNRIARLAPVSVALAVLVGGFVGVAVSAALIAVGLVQLDDLRGAALHYSAALALAVSLHALANRQRGASRPFRATLVVAVLLAFALRRWLIVWVNLQPLEWGSGPGGVTTALVFPLEGVLLGAMLALDARSEPSASSHCGSGPPASSKAKGQPPASSHAKGRPPASSRAKGQPPESSQA